MCDLYKTMGKHKKHKIERRERIEGPGGLKLILKVGGQGTPEHTSEWAYGSGSTSFTHDENSGQHVHVHPDGSYFTIHRSHHKKSKKKKKKKDKERNKDRKRDKERKHRHHHRDKDRDKDRDRERKRRHESSQEDEDGTLSLTGSIPSLGSPSGREPRQCVLRQQQQRGPLQRALDQLLRALEKRDPQQFFAWPVTDNIAPGYSAIISNPMDFSTMRQKMEENLYHNLQAFMDDFKLMCSNAMQYNHVDTVYYKASKKLMQSGVRIVQPDKIGWLIALVPELTSRDLGFEITPELRQEQRATSAASGEEQNDENDSCGNADVNGGGGGGAGVAGVAGVAGTSTCVAKRKVMPASKFVAIPDDLTPAQILARAQGAAREAKVRMSLKSTGTNMGFLRQRKDGTTSLNILIGGDGVIPGTRKRPVLLGQLTGKVHEGTSQIQGFREDRRNITKPVKPLYYGAFGSYAPSYDSAFSNLSKEESDLVYHTYGSDTAVQYAESILDFAKDCDYTLHMVDSLLDLLTGGDHTKTKKVLDEKRSLRDEEEAIKCVLDVAGKATPLESETSEPDINLDELRSLSALGIDTTFLNDIEDEIKTTDELRELQRRLDANSQLLAKLHQTQYQRLSAPLPAQLNMIAAPSEAELAIAETVTDNLTEMAKRVQPADVAPVHSIHKAIGVAMPAEMEMGGADVPDLESELRQFFESENNLNHSPLRDDKTIEEILME